MRVKMILPALTEALGPPRRGVTRRHRLGCTGLALLVVLILLGAGGWVWLADPFGWDGAWDGVRAVATSQERFRDWVEGFGLWAPFVFFVAQAVQVIVAPLPGGVFTPVGAVAFGPWAGLALSLSGSTAGAAVVLALARRWGRPLVLRLVGPATLDRYAGIFEARGGVWLFLVFVIPFMPGDALCALAGMSSISFRRFLVLSTLGRLPSTALAIVLVAELADSPAWVWPLAALVLAAALALGVVNRSRVEAWLLRRAAAGSGPAAGPRPGGGSCATIGGALSLRAAPVSGPPDAAERSVVAEVRLAPAFARRYVVETLDWPRRGALERPRLPGRR